MRFSFGIESKENPWLDIEGLLEVWFDGDDVLRDTL